MSPADRPSLGIVPAVQLDLPAFDDLGRQCLLAGAEQMGTGIFFDDLAGLGEGFEVGGTQRKILGSAESAGKPGEVLRVYIVHTVQ